MVIGGGVMRIAEQKQQIEEIISQGDAESAKELIDTYAAICPQDIDVISMRLNYCLMTGDLEAAAALALEGVRRLPLNGDMQYNLAYVYEVMQQWLEAYIGYCKAKYIYEYTGDEKVNSLEIETCANRMLERFEESMEYISNKKEGEEIKSKFQGVIGMQRNQFGLKENAFRSYEKIVGTYYYETYLKRRFVGVFKDQFLSHYQQGNENMDVIHLKAEFLNVVENDHIHLWDPAGTCDAEYLLPIACSKAPTIHCFQGTGQKYNIAQYADNHFNYYRVKNDTRILSTNKCYYGNPIPLRRLPDKKRLVLSIFVDGLAQCMLKGEDFQKNMPYTYEYFKKGTICNRAYNTAEWTYPSITNYVTGLNTIHHMLFHDAMDSAIPLDVPTLAEYFHEDGYYTAKFCGNWRIIPSYGHARGYDRFVYQHQWVGFKVQEVIADVIDHIEAFQDVNQYLWLSIGDLHDIADANDLPVDVQRDLPLELRTYEDVGATSAKQSFSRNKIEAYIHQIRHVDKWLHVLYSYLEETFPENEIIVSLFSDHGQGYLIENAHFLSKERSNVAFMFRGGDAEGKGIIEEIISASDYSNILRKLANVNLSEVPTDGRLPECFGGEAARDYALTESIHPKDPYQAVIFAENETFFFVNPDPVQDDGRFRLKDYQCWLEDTDRNRIEDSKKREKYLNIVLEHIAPILIYE